MDRQSKDDLLFQESQSEDEGINEDNMPKGLHGFMMRHMGYQDAAHPGDKSKKPFPLVPIVLMIMVGLHVVSAIYFSRTGSESFLFNSPMTYGMIAASFIFAIFKFRHVLGIIRREEKLLAQEIANGASNTTGVQQEQDQELLP